MRGNVTLKFVGDESQRRLSLPLQELAEQSHSGSAVATRLNEDLDHVSVLIDGTPKILSLTIDRDEDFVQEPCVSESALSPLQTSCIIETELRAPPADCLVGHNDSSFGEQILDISETDSESVVQPDCVTDDFGRKTVAVIAGSRGFHPVTLAVLGSS